jgi:hypothetical protein
MSDRYGDLLDALAQADTRLFPPDLNIALQQYVRDLEGRLAAQEARLRALEIAREHDA